MRLRVRGRRMTAAPAILALLACGVAGCTQPQPVPPRPVVRLITGTPGARFHPLGQALARVYAEAFPSAEIRVLESAGSIANVEALQRGEADIGLAYADVAYMAHVGRLGARPVVFGDLRGIAVLELAPVHLVVRAGAAISGEKDLPGKRIAVGPMGSGSALTADIVLRALGMGPEAARVEPLRYNEAAARLAAGTIDALFVTGSDPVDAVRAATAAGGRLLPLGGAAIEHLRHEYPFFRPTVIHGGTYPGHPATIQTIGVDNLLLCRRGADESLVHDVTARLFAQLPSMSILAGMDLEQAPATPIPLHDGAVRYYRERELTR